MPRGSGARRLRFGEFLVDAAARELYRCERPLHLTPTMFDLLVRFLERPGEVLTRRELLDGVWQGRFVEDANLTQTVFLLRRALSDDAPNAWIVTEPGRGYRFIGNVAVADDAEKPAEIETAPGEAPSPRRRIGLAFLGIGLVVAGAAAAGWWVLRRDPPSPSVTTVAVLPFVDVATGEPTALGMGLADAAANILEPRRGLAVHPLSTVLEHLRAGAPPSEIARRLGVETLVTGTIERVGPEARVTVRVVRGDGSTVWEGAIEGPGSDLFLLQERVASQVAAAVDPGGPSRPPAASTARGTERFASYEWLMEGRYHLVSRNPQALVEAREAFGRALEIDPGYADAWADLAVTEFLLGTYSVGGLTARERCRRSREAAERALRYRPEFGAVETLLGTLALHCHYDFAAAEPHFRRGLRLAPESARAHHWYAWHLLATGRGREALAELERALELDPMSLIARSALGLVLASTDDLRGALETFDALLAIDPEFGRAHLNRGLVLEEMGRLAEAEASFRRADRLLPGSPEVRGALAHVRVLRGGAPPPPEDLARLPPLQQAFVHAASGEVEAGVAALSTAVDRREVWVWVLRDDDRLDPLRRHPAIRRIEEKVGIPLVAAD